MVAEIGGQVVGFAMGTTIKKARSAWMYGYLLWLGVDPKYTRKGVGGMLLEQFRSLMEKEGVRILMVDTQADNLPAIEFFRNKGFEKPTNHVYMTMNLQKDD